MGKLKYCRLLLFSKRKFLMKSIFSYDIIRRARDYGIVKEISSWTSFSRKNKRGKVLFYVKWLSVVYTIKSPITSISLTSDMILKSEF